MKQLENLNKIALHEKGSVIANIQCKGLEWAVNKVVTCSEDYYYVHDIDKDFYESGEIKDLLSQIAESGTDFFEKVNDPTTHEKAMEQMADGSWVILQCTPDELDIMLRYMGYGFYTVIVDFT